MKLKTFVITLMFCFSTKLVLGEDTVRLDPTFSNFAITATTSSTIILNTDLPTVQPTTEATAAKVYVPLNRTDINTNKYFLDSVGGLPTILDTTDSAKLINFPMRLNVSVTDQYLYAAVFDSNSSDTLKWEVVAAYSLTPFNNVTNSDIVFRVSPTVVCIQTPCADLGPASTAPSTKTFKMYFFLSTVAAYTLGQTFDPLVAPLNNGIFYDVAMSNKILTPADYAGTITAIRRGDKRVAIEYTTTGMLEAESIRVFNHNGANGSADLAIGESATYNAGAAPMGTEYPYIQNGELTVRDLVNGTPYFFSIFIVNKFKFASPLSNVAEGSPSEIQELLKENGCFLLTAGFGENHYIIDYFRNFRDRVLMNFWAGRLFVNVYYEYAPKYALFIYENEAIRAVIRGVAYTIYYAFNHIYIVILGAFLIPVLFFLFFSLRKIKILKA